MKAESVLSEIRNAKASNKKLLALLIDPDKLSEKKLSDLVSKANSSGVDLIFIGGSLLVSDALSTCIKTVKKHTNKPVLLFPGSILQLSPEADAVLFLSLISGRNPDLLIGNHVIAAPYLKQMDLEVISTGYILVDSGQATTASYMSNSNPIPHNKPEIAACTAMAGEMLGLKLIYLDGGSGAKNPISTEMIAAVNQSTEAPIIVGGGIKTIEKAIENCKAGADVIVVGNATESNPNIIGEIALAIKNI